MTEIELSGMKSNSICKEPSNSDHKSKFVRAMEQTQQLRHDAKLTRMDFVEESAKHEIYECARDRNIWYNDREGVQICQLLP